MDYAFADVLIFFIVNVHLVFRRAYVAFAAGLFDVLSEISQKLYASAFVVVIDEINDCLNPFCGFVFSVLIYFIRKIEMFAVESFC